MYMSTKKKYFITNGFNEGLFLHYLRLIPLLSYLHKVVVFLDKSF